MLNLLQHRIWPAVHKRIPSQNKNGQAVGMGQACRCHHVGSTGANRGRSDHDLAAQLGFGITNRRQRHGLLILPAPHRQLVFHLNQSLGKASHIAVAKYRKHPRKQGFLFALNHRELVDEITHQSLRHG